MTQDDKRTYEQRIADLAAQINPHVHFASLTEATAISQPHRHSCTSEVGRKLESMAEALYESAGKHGFMGALDAIGVSNPNEYRVRMSALREAIVQCARKYANNREPVHA
jgi:hypothetical protein